MFFCGGLGFAGEETRAQMLICGGLGSAGEETHAQTLSFAQTLISMVAWSLLDMLPTASKRIAHRLPTEHRRFLHRRFL